jgi:hypothetical protein
LKDEKLQGEVSSTVDTQPAMIEDMPQPLTPSNIQYANAPGFYEMNPNYPPSPRAVKPELSASQEPPFVNSPPISLNIFPLADLSAMMFPNPDPFAYPNQSTDFNYDIAMSNGTGAEGAEFSYPTAANGEPIPRSDSSSGFTYANNSAEQPQQPPQYSQDVDMQVIGTMPLYMMQNTSNTDSPVTTSLQLSSGSTPVNGSPMRQPPLQNGRTEQNVKFYQAAPPNVNLDTLLGGEEWNGLPGDRSAMNAFVSGSTVNLNEGAFRKRTTVGQPQQQGQQAPLQFQDLSPSVLGWGLEGF